MKYAAIIFLFIACKKQSIQVPQVEPDSAYITHRHIDFGYSSGSCGYGIRDNGDGTIQFKSSGGEWVCFKDLKAFDSMLFGGFRSGLFSQTGAIKTLQTQVKEIENRKVH